jgi:hypothetical protein
MNDDNILQRLPLAECVEKDEVIDVIFDSTTGVPNDDRLYQSMLERIRKRRFSPRLSSPAVWMPRNFSTGTRGSMQETVRHVSNAR